MILDERLFEDITLSDKRNLLIEKAPSAIKGKNSSKTVTSDNYVNEIGDPFTFTSSTEYGEFSGNGYIMDKKGNEYPVKTSSYDSDAGRIAGGKTNYYVTILYKGTPLKWSGYRAVFNTSHNEDIISDLKDGYYLEDYCARHPDVDSAGRDIVRKLASQGDPDALSYKQLGINKVKDKESKAFSPIDLRSYDAKIENGTITPNSSEGDVATLLKAPNFISQVKSILNVNGYSINDFNGAIIRGEIKPAGVSSYQRKLSIDNKTGDVSFRVPISKHKKNSNKLGSLEVSDSDIKGYDSVDVIVSISTIDLRNCDFINQLTKVIKKYRRSERATAIKNNAARIFNNKRSFQFGDIKQDKIDSRDEATRDYDNRTSDMLAGKWLDFNDFKRFIEAIPAKELDKAEQEVSSNEEPVYNSTRSASDIKALKAKPSDYEKMKNWNEGKRRENIKLCSDAKLLMYRDICLEMGYEDQLQQINAELSNRNITESFKRTRKLKEDFDDVVVTQIPDVDIEVKAGDIELRGPIPGVDTGIADLLLSLINGENETIQSYNTFIASLEGHEDFIKVITDIQQEEMNHVGMLQTLLKEVSPNAEVIHQGEVEAEGYLDKEDKNSLEIDQMIGEIDDSFDNGFGGIYV